MAADPGWQRSRRRAFHSSNERRGLYLGAQTHSDDGDVSGHHNNFDYWVAKLDETGGIEWQRAFGGSANEYLGTVIPTTDGGYFVCGIAGSSNGDVVGNHGLSDVWVLKLDGSGAFNGKKPSVVQDLSTPMKRYKQPMAVTSFLPIRGQ